jgi:hypothetical protein
MVIEHRLHLVDLLEQERYLLIGQQLESHAAPDTLHLIQHHLNLELLRSLLPDLHAQLDMRHHAQIKHLLEIELLLARVQRNLTMLCDPSPMPLTHTLVLQRHKQRQERPELFDRRLQLLCHSAYKVDFPILHEFHHIHQIAVTI